MSKVKMSMTGSDMSECRGMSEPFCFAFDSVGKKPSRDTPMLAHGVIFSTFLIAPGETMAVCAPTDDPRLNGFIEWVWRNYLDERKARFNKLLTEVQEVIATKEEGVAALKRRIAEIDKAISTHKQ